MMRNWALKELALPSGQCGRDVAGFVPRNIVAPSSKGHAKLDSPEVPTVKRMGSSRRPLARRASVKALVIEDESVIALALAFELETEGWAATLAGDATEALQVLATQRFDLAIVDLSLPDASGSSLICRMRELAPTMRLIVCTGYAPNSSQVQDLPTDILVVHKPCSPADFMRAVHVTMGGLASQEHPASAPHPQ
jgi:CheY-like chemotaxis protein